MRHVVVTESQQLLRDAAARFLRDKYSFEHRETIRKSGGFDAAIWQELAELGWLGLPFPEVAGGFGGNMLDVMLLMEVTGPALLAEPYMPTIAAGTAVLAGGSKELRQEILPALIAGKMRLALAFAERNSGYEVDPVATKATPAGTGYRIDGSKSVVIGAPFADKLVVSAAHENGPMLFLVSADAPGVAMRSYATIDGQAAAEVIFAGTMVGKEAVLGRSGGGAAILKLAIDAGTIALLGEAAGLAQAAVDITAQYLNTREQFGRKLATFQALRHRVARLYIGKEELRALCRQAAAAFVQDPGSAETRESIAAAKVYVGRMGRHICEEAIQLHGAIAIADEYVVGHFLKRMVTIDHMFGNANHHFDIYASTTRSLASF